MNHSITSVAMDYELQIYAAQQLRRERKLRDRLNPLESYDHTEIKQLFRFESTSILQITDVLEIDLRRSTLRNKSLQPLQQVCLALRFYATGSMQLSLGAWLHVNQSTVSRVVWDVTRTICSRMRGEISFPDGFFGLKQAFYQLSGLGNIVGCVDCTHVPISRPSQFGQEYMNRKNWYSINVQAICDHDCRFLDIVAAWPGSAHDSRIFRNSSVYDRFLTRELNGTLLGDGGYRLNPFLFTPFNNPRDDIEENFNRVHASTRNCIERAFGQLKRRFAALHIPLCTCICVNRVCPTIVACCILYNLAKRKRGGMDFSGNVEDENHPRMAGAAARSDAAQQLYERY